MNILISGSHGFIGSAVFEHFQEQGHQLLRLIRPTQIAHSDEIFWEPVSQFINQNKLKNIDAVIHLAGENIFGRWNEKKKQAIYDSRVIGTDFLCKTLAGLAPKPKVLLCASAIGYYGNRGDEEMTESDSPGNSFLGQVCQDVETATQAAAKAGIRVVNLRFGMVLGKEGGALAKMLPAFKMGMGGPLGDGQQWVSWISMADTVGVIEFAMTHKKLSGAVNVTAPRPVRNKEFSQTIGKTLHRPEPVPVPKSMLHLMFGDFAEEALLSSTRALPEKLTHTGYTFQHPTLQTALDSILHKE
ncbi:MAG: TIGR01777 family protein [Phycisphaerae bacterium]|nr:TIGR01777 family protein [Phycisphaerae bacterium]